MRVSALVIVGLLAGTVSLGSARCGDQPGDGESVRANVAAVVAQCCCGDPQAEPPLRRQPFQCVRGAVLLAVRTGSLPGRCLGPVVRRSLRTCRRHGCPGSTTTTTLPAPSCDSDAQCDDGNPCSADRCESGGCVNVCVCLGPGDTFTCCPGPLAECGSTTTTTLPPRRYRYFYTCGYPVCRVDDDTPIPGVPRCTTERVGESCEKPGALCDPGVGCGVKVLCTERDPARICPISTRAAKRDIRYLTPADADRLRDELLRLPLATYAYRSEDPSAGRHLGFIIDDVGKSAAVAADGTMVDVYAYASMAVAAVQAQAREIELLRKEIDELRGQCRATAGQ